MSVSGVLLLLAAICVVLAAVSAVLISVFLDQRGIKTPFPFMGLFIFRNLNRYREITRTETGKIGPLFYSYVVPINTALILVLASLSLRIF